jgi:hypothetical protein
VTVEDHVKLYIGELVIQVARLNAEKSELEARLKQMEDEKAAVK